MFIVNFVLKLYLILSLKHCIRRYILAKVSHISFKQFCKSNFLFQSSFILSMLLFKNLQSAASSFSESYLSYHSFCSKKKSACPFRKISTFIIDKSLDHILKVSHCLSLFKIRKTLKTDNHFYQLKKKRLLLSKICAFWPLSMLEKYHGEFLLQINSIKNTDKAQNKFIQPKW